jgi:hypothetical protein
VAFESVDVGADDDGDAGTDGDGDADVGGANVKCVQGGLEGGDIHQENMTIAAAATWCLGNVKCAAFTAAGQ